MVRLHCPHVAAHESAEYLAPAPPPAPLEPEEPLPAAPSSSPIDLLASTQSMTLSMRAFFMQRSECVVEVSEGEAFTWARHIRDC